jgi:hypothetical protein
VIGTKLKLRSNEYWVPSLSFDEVERFALDGTLAKVPQNGVTMLAIPESREAAMTVLLAALRWNYPEITRNEVARELDLDNCEMAMAAVMGSTKLLKLGQEAGAGEAKP